jgi:hypothetical protein
MKTEREKKLEVALLTERIERSSGKKVLFKENHGMENLKSTQAVSNYIKDQIEDEVSDNLYSGATAEFHVKYNGNENAYDVTVKY